MATTFGQGGTAVVIGISDYRDANITDLNYAHRDAEAFADYLRGAGTETRVMTDGAATRAAIESAMAWQRAHTSAGETAILYFAGHGDAETATAGHTTGYLLAHDTPPNNYPLTAIGVESLNDHLAALTTKGCKALVVTDACHAGTLAGSAINGPRLTATQLMEQREGQVRMLSCLPEELALEGPQWGGGRGVFSYYFVDALKGMADEDRDNEVDLYEMETFVRERVREATQRKQLPVLSGDQRAGIHFATETDTSGTRRDNRTRDLQQEFMEGLVAMATPESQRAYVRFDRALQRGDLLEPEDRSALSYYQALRKDPALLPLGSVFTERMIVGLLDSVQQALTDYLATDREELYLRALSDDCYSRYVTYLEQAAEMVGENDPRWRDIQAQKHYFRAVRLRTTGLRDHALAIENFTSGMEEINLALKYNDRAAYIWNELGLLELRLDDLPAGEIAFRKAVDLSPTWALPYVNLGINLRHAALRGNTSPERLKEARSAYEKAIRLKPDNSLAYNSLGNLLADMGAPVDTVAAYFKRALLIDDRYPDARYNLAYLLSDVPGRSEEAKKLLLSLAEEFPEEADNYFLLGYTYNYQSKIPQATEALRSALRIDPTHVGAFNSLMALAGRADADKASTKLFFEEQITHHPSSPLLYVGLAEVDTSSSDWLAAAVKAPLPEQATIALFDELGGLLYGRGHESKAEIAFTKAAELQPGDASGLMRLANLYRATGEAKKAGLAIREALELANPEQLSEYCPLFTGDGYYAPLMQSRRMQTALKKYCHE